MIKINFVNSYSNPCQRDIFSQNISINKTSQKNLITYSPTFKNTTIPKGAKNIQKSRGFLATIAAFLGLTTKKVSEENKTPVIKESPIVEKKETYSFKPAEYTEAELEGITFWERVNNNNERFVELREILKHKENHKKEDELKKEEVLLLADYLKEKTKILSIYLKSHPECSARELIELRKLDKEASKYYMDVAKYCPYANVDEYKKIAKVFCSLWPKERQAVASFSRQRELIKKMDELQQKDPNDYTLELYFSEYKFTFPQNDREKLAGISIKTTKVKELPVMTIDDLIKRLEFLKTPEGKTEHLK